MQIDVCNRFKEYDKRKVLGRHLDYAALKKIALPSALHKNVTEFEYDKVAQLKLRRMLNFARAE
jgi:hypothetical protein